MSNYIPTVGNSEWQEGDTTVQNQEQEIVIEDNLLGAGRVLQVQGMGAETLTLVITDEDEHETHQNEDNLLKNAERSNSSRSGKKKFSDFEESDLDDPKRAKRMWNFAKREIDLRNAKINDLLNKNRKLVKVISETKNLRSLKLKNCILNQEVIALKQLLDLKNFHKAIGDIVDS